MPDESFFLKIDVLGKYNVNQLLAVLQRGDSVRRLIQFKLIPVPAKALGLIDDHSAIFDTDFL